ncbi:MAG TPA: alpha/beta hydrolase [Limosilactobacillus reuteri]|nr:alpha/beta hydrolase [Limosilactobacillus reuteri]
MIKYTWVNQLANLVMLLLQTYMRNLLVPHPGTKAKHVNREQISVIGISGGAGFALSAAAVDTRIKSVVTISMYDMTDIREMANLAPEQLFQLKDQLSKQRWDDFENGQPDYHPSFPEEPYDSIDDLPNHDELTNEWLRFYALKRGFHPNARGTATTTSNLAMLEFSALDYIKEISPRPILFIYLWRQCSLPFLFRESLLPC